MKTKQTILMFLLASLAVGTSLYAGDSDVDTAFCDVAGPYCLVFDGVDDYVDLGNNASLQLSGNLTMTAWVRLDPGTSGQQMGIVGKLRGANDRGFGLVRHTNDRFMLLRGDGSTIWGAYGNTVPVESEWYHVAAMLTDTSARLFVNGNSDMTQSRRSYLDSGQYAFIGRLASDSSSSLFDGFIDDVRIFNRDLSQSEVQTVMTTLPGGPVTGMVGYWNLNQGSGQVALDNSGYGNHGRLGVTSGSETSDPQWVDNSIFCGSPPTPPTISGYITVGGVGLSSVTVAANNGGGSTSTNSFGYYSLTVPYGWSGRVTPSLTNYTFSPTHNDYVSLTTDQTNQHYLATHVSPSNPVISGYITLGGLGLSGVTITANNGGGSTTTNSAGFYNVTVPYGWSGRVTPSLSGYIFAPPYTDYVSVTTNRYQNYQATQIAPTDPKITGYVVYGGSPLAGVTISANNGGSSTTTNSSGFYSMTVPYGWTGRVTPMLSGYAFTPAYLDYVTVTADQYNQNYQASQVAPTSPKIIGYVTYNGLGLGGVTIATNNSGGSTTTNSSGFYSLPVPYGWTGQVTPTLGGYSFTPPYLNYITVTADQYNQNYFATQVAPQPKISGYISLNGLALENVTVTADNGGSSTTTNNAGFYSLTVPYGWSGRVTPALADYSFIPPYRDYLSVTVDQYNQFYEALLVDTYYVDTTNGNDGNSGHSPAQAFQTIQRGIDATVNGNTVIVLDGLYSGPGNIELDFHGKAITVETQNGPEAVVIDCQQAGRAFYFHSSEGSDAVVNGFTVTNGNAYYGGAIYCTNASPTITGCVLRQNSGVLGGAVYLENNSTSILSQCSLLDNSPNGAIYINNSAPQLLNCVVADNVALSSHGGAIRIDNGFKQTRIKNCTVANNVTNLDGGGLWCRYNTVIVTNSIFWGNEAQGNGEQMRVSNSATLTVKYTTVEGGQAGIVSNGSLNWESSNMDEDPQLADPDNSDYHLRSVRGRYWTQEDVWLADEVTSPAIDAGDPTDDVGDEMEPHGDIVNMGAYGGTAEASRSDDTECVLVRDEDGNGTIEYPADLFALIERWLIDYENYVAP